MFEIILNLILGSVVTVVALWCLCVVGLALLKVSQFVPVAYRSLKAVRWPYVIFHSTLGSVVSVMVSPELPPPFVMAAGIVSAILSAAAYIGMRDFIDPKHLRSVTLKKTVH